MLAIFHAELQHVLYGKGKPRNPFDLELVVLKGDLDALQTLLVKTEQFEERGVQRILNRNNDTITDAVGREIRVTTHDEALIVLSRAVPGHLGELKALCTSN